MRIWKSLEFCNLEPREFGRVWNLEPRKDYIFLVTQMIFELNVSDISKSEKYLKLEVQMFLEYTYEYMLLYITFFNARG